MRPRISIRGSDRLSVGRSIGRSVCLSISLSVRLSRVFFKSRKSTIMTNLTYLTSLTCKSDKSDKSLCHSILVPYFRHIFVRINLFFFLSTKSLKMRKVFVNKANQANFCAISQIFLNLLGYYGYSSSLTFDNFGL